jgi:hypothetical protein
MPLFNKSKIFTLALQIKHITHSFKLGGITINFTWLFGTICFLETYFYKIKGRETFSRSQNYLNAFEDIVGLTESFSTSAGLCSVHMEIKFFCF